MASENVQITLHTKLDELRRELEPKIEKKISDRTFWTVVIIIVSAIGGVYFWLMSMNVKIACLETKMEMTSSPTTQPAKQ